MPMISAIIPTIQIPVKGYRNPNSERIMHNGPPFESGCAPVEKKLIQNTDPNMISPIGMNNVTTLTQRAIFISNSKRGF